MSDKTIVFRPKAKRDLINLLTYFQLNGGEALKNRFLRMQKKTIQRIQAFPDLGSLWESDSAPVEELRFRLIERFQSYAVFYRRADNAIDIFRILHCARDLEICMQDLD